MKTFTTTLRKLFRPDGTTSFSPDDLLFQAQLPFLKAHFRPYLKDVEMPKDGGDATFICQLRDSDTIRCFRRDVFRGEWGDFVPKGITISAAEYDRGPLTIRVKVGRDK